MNFESLKVSEVMQTLKHKCMISISIKYQEDGNS